MSTDGSTTVVAGIEVPFDSPILLAVLVIHVCFGLSCVVTGAIAMLSEKRRGRHSVCGTAYYWSLWVVFVTASTLAMVRWAEDYHLFILGTLSLAGGTMGRPALRRPHLRSVRWHIALMGASYILLLTAFYVDNGPSLPLWKELPALAFWLLPSAFGVPLTIYALRHRRLAREGPRMFRRWA